MSHCSRRFAFAPVIRWLLCLARVFALLVTGSAQALQVSDDRGIRVNFARPPQRIVSLLPSLTETVCELGQCARLVGVDRYSNYPVSVTKLAQLGGGMDPNIEAIVALKPDLVLIALSSRVGERLQSLGLNVLALEPKNHADVRRVIEILGSVLGVVDAGQHWRLIDAAVSDAAQALSAKARNRRVYFEVNAGPYAASEGSFIGETLTRLGVKNIVPASLGPFPLLNPEYVVRANPDVIMVSAYSDGALAARPGWANLSAIRLQRVCVFTPAQSDVMVRAGPRMVQGARLMLQCLLDKMP
jgi:iron complex transport system substrate-binding protein